jgi:hypothetical protein
MDWQEFQEAKSRLCPSGLPPMLYQSGGFQGDNRTYAESQKGFWCENSQSALFNGQLGGRDFIWNGNKVRVMGDFETGGHPALAGFDPVYCAGIIDDNFFFFHSGHYRPSLKNALYFFCDFTEKSCRDLAGADRDDQVRKLCDIPLRIYRGQGMGRTYDTTFELEANDGAGPPQISGRSSAGPIAIGGAVPIPIAGSQPISIGGARPIPIGGVGREPGPQRTNQQILGVTPVGEFFSNQLIRTWMPDSERSACAVCKNGFSVIVRKHHCRKCGEVVCDACSRHRVELRDPVAQPGKPAESGPFRVCNNCN